MSGIMGLISGKEFADNSFHSFNNRRQTFWNYPQGAATLTYLLSLMEDEETDTAKNFGWDEIRYSYPRTTLAGSDGPISPTGSDTSSSSPTSLVADTVYRIEVVSNTEFAVGDAIAILDCAIASQTYTKTVRGVVTEIVSGSTTKLEFRALHAVASIENTVGALVTATTYVTKLGSAYAEGSRSGSGRMLVPVEPTNHTQIFKDAIEFTGSALKIPTDFDKTGAYKTKAKTAALDHLVGMEMGFLFGQKHLYNSALAAGGAFGGSTTPTRTTGGVLHFLEEWESAAGGTAGYRPGGAALTADSDDDKRIIEVSSGTMTVADWDGYIERVFRKANSADGSKLCLIGNGAGKALQSLIKREIVRVLPSDEAGDTYKMRIKSIETPWGVLHVKSHPLFTDNPATRNSMMILDVPFLKYRPLNDRDTVLLPNRQDNDEDGRKDIWMTEAGLELQFPEAHMFLKNVQTIT